MKNAIVLLSYYFIYIERKYLLMRNLATILPLKFKLPGKFQRCNTIDGSIERRKLLSGGGGGGGGGVVVEGGGEGEGGLNNFI